MVKDLKRWVKPYTSSRIKTRNFLSNISYTGVKSEDFVDNNFSFDMITLLTENINPFSLECKIVDLKNVELFIGYAISVYIEHFLNIYVKRLTLFI